MYSFLSERLIFPLSDVFLKTSVTKNYHWLQKTQWWSPEQLQELQNAKLRVLIKHAYDNVPYYHRVLEDRGLTDKDIKTSDDLLKLPILTKSIIKQNYEDMLVKNFKKWRPIPSSTGGSTGEPLKFYITKDVASITWAGMFRGWGWAGYKIGDKRVKFGGSSLIPNEASSLFDIVRNKLERNLLLSAVSMNDEKNIKYAYMIKKYQPRFIYCYPSSLFFFANFCKNRDIDIRFDAVFSTAEVLLPNYRSTIEKQFQCKVFDEYGTYDGGGQALECEAHQGFHISVEKVIMEITDGNGKRLPSGKEGHIIVTDLYNYAMPFLRYDVGDIGVFSDKSCICGRSLPLLNTIEGRITDVIIFSNGVKLSGAAVPCMLKDSHLQQFQLIQTEKDELLLKIVQDIDYSERDTRFILNALEYHCGKGVKVKLEFCQHINPENNNKYRFIIGKQ